MRILIIGSGAREHAILSSVRKSGRATKIFVAPGNGGTAPLAENIPIPANNIDLLLRFAQEQNIDLTIVGPELPLTLGIVDTFQKAGLKIFGPSQKASILEGSKIFTKEFCHQFKIPTAPFATFINAQDARNYLKEKKCYPIVIKADGLAAGKGVVIAQNESEADKTIQDMLVYEKFGEAGRQILIEDFLIGEEASFIVLTDGNKHLAFPPSQDHKRIFDNDEGPNTGGMGAYAPAPVVSPELAEKITTRIIEPTLHGLKEIDCPYLGFLYAGVMIVDNEPFLIEYNVRLGDPEAEVILPLLKSDFLDLIEHTLAKKLDACAAGFSGESCVGVVLASQGYPGEYRDAQAIGGLNAISDPDVQVFHAGTKISGDKVVSSGGRVLVVTAKAPQLGEAIKKVYRSVKKISFGGAHFRLDIGARGLKHLKQRAK